MNVMIPYKRDFVTLNKAVINFLPRCSYHLLYYRSTQNLTSQFCFQQYQVQVLQAVVQLENVCACATHVPSQLSGRKNPGIFFPPKAQFPGQTEKNQNHHRPEYDDSAN